MMNDPFRERPHVPRQAQPLGTSAQVAPQPDRGRTRHRNRAATYGPATWTDQPRAKRGSIPMPIPIPTPWREGGLNWLVQRFPKRAKPSKYRRCVDHRVIPCDFHNVPESDGFAHVAHEAVAAASQYLREAVRVEKRIEYKSA